MNQTKMPKQSSVADVNVYSLSVSPADVSAQHTLIAQDATSLQLEIDAKGTATGVLIGSNADTNFICQTSAGVDILNVDGGAATVTANILPNPTVTVPITATAGAALVAADMGGSTIPITQNGATAIAITLPAVAQGYRCRLVISTAAAANVTVDPAGTETFIGVIHNDVTSVLPATGDTLTFVGGTNALGDYIDLSYGGAGVWHAVCGSSANGGITIT